MQLVQDELANTHDCARSQFPHIFGAHMNTLFNIQVKI
jgi:hypothetical protein